MTKFAPISEFLPHQVPMILIDQLIDITAHSVHCQVTINNSGLFFDPQKKAVPAWVGIEFMAQTVAAWSGYHASQKGLQAPIGFLLGSRRYSSECALFSEGAVLDIHAQQLMESDGMAAFACVIKQGGKELASSQLNVFLPSPDKLQQILGSAKE